MNLRYSLRLLLTPKILLLTELLILLAFSLTYVPIATIWLNLLLGWTTAIILEVFLNARRKEVVHLPEAAIITATIIVGVLATTTPPVLIILAVTGGILAKHFLRYKNRHLLNPANFAVLILIFFFNQPAEWWLAANLPVIILLGLYIMYRLKRVAEPLVFLTIYFPLVFVTSPQVTSDFIKTTLTADFSIYFFAFVMLVEPQTSAWSVKGRYVNSALTALLATTASLLGLKAPLILALAAVNLVTPLVNQYTKLNKPGNKKSREGGQSED